MAGITVTCSMSLGKVVPYPEVDSSRNDVELEQVEEFKGKQLTAAAKTEKEIRI